MLFLKRYPHLGERLRALLIPASPSWIDLPCRACLGPMDASGSAGICSRCWAGLANLEEGRCEICALVHGDQPCPDPCLWEQGDALWDYRGGRPPLGALLVPAIKDGELGWRNALLRRLKHAPLPEFCHRADLVTVVPSALHRRWLRGFDLAEDVAQIVADRMNLPFRRLLKRKGWSTRQAVQTESQRRRLPMKTMALRRAARCEGLDILLVDDVWTTGTTLLRCAQRLKEGGAHGIRVLSLFRAV